MRRRKMRRLFHNLLPGIFLALLSLNPACSVAQKNKDNTAVLPEFFLSHSMYGGAFYDHNRLRLLDDKSFKDIHELYTIDDYLIIPPKEDEIITIGTKIKIEKIQFTQVKSVNLILN